MTQVSRPTTRIEHELVLATSTRDFKMPNGKRRMRQPYWIASDQKEEDSKNTRLFLFEFIDKDTDVEQLRALIQAGKVWTLPQYTADPETSKTDN